MTTAAFTTDEELAGLAIKGDQAAFADLYERYFDKVYDLIARMMRNPAEAGDVAQDTFMKILAGLGTRPPHTSFRAWLYTIARNSAIDRIRSRRHVVAIQPEEPDEEDRRFHQAIPTSDDRPDMIAESEDLAALVWQAAKGLNSNEYNLLDLNLRQGLEPKEIADVLETTRGNVYTMLSRLRDSFEQSVTALLLSRRGRSDCAELKEILTDTQESDELNTRTRRAVNRHASRCDVCSDNRGRFVTASELFGGFAPVLPGIAFKDELLGALMQQFPAAAGSGPSLSSSTPSTSSNVPDSGVESAQADSSGTSSAASIGSHTGFLASSSVAFKGLIIGGAVAVVGTVAAVIGIISMAEDSSPQPSENPAGISAPIAPNGEEAQPGAGNFFSPSMIGSLFSEPEACPLDARATVSNGYLADFNGDSLLDVAVADRMDNLGIWINKGDGSFSDPMNHPTGPGPQDVVAGDFNKDGTPDVAVAHASAAITIHLSGIDASLSEGTLYSADINSPTAMVTGDFDGDGDQDIAAAVTNQNVVIFLNDGSGSFDEKYEVPLEGNPESIVGADWDSDGDLDLAVGSLNFGISLLINDGAGSFEAESLHEDKFLRRIASGDIDGDGDADLLGRGDTGGQDPVDRVVVLKNAGGGSFGSPEYLNVQTSTARQDIVVGDVDMDSDLDILLSGGVAIEILLNDGEGTFADREIVELFPDFAASRQRGWVLDVGDVDNDGDNDIVVAATEPDRFMVLRNNVVSSSTGKLVQFSVTVEGDGFVNDSSSGFRCGPNEKCTLEIDKGSEINIYTDSPATPGSDVRFDKWEGDCKAFEGDHYPSFTIDDDKVCTAKFTR